jgi:hypothetical protein
VGGPGECDVFLVFECRRLPDLFHLWKIPPTPRLRAIPLPPVAPGYDTLSHGGHYGGGDDREDDNFPGGGISNHQSAQQRTDTLVQEAESSTSLAAAKPDNIENNVQSEVSIFFYLARNRALY